MRWGLLLVLCGCGAILESTDGNDGDDVEEAEQQMDGTEATVDVARDWTGHEESVMTDVPVPMDDASTAEDQLADEAPTDEATAEDVACVPGVWMCSGVCSGGWFEITRACAPSCGICTTGEPATYNAAYCAEEGVVGLPCHPPPGA